MITFPADDRPDDPTPSVRGAVGRPLDAARADALREAALEVLQEVGYDRLTIDAVAARARAGKATVYRRWPSKAELVVDACACRARAAESAPDTGSLRSDLLALVAAKVAKLERGELDQMLGLISALPRHPALREAFRARFVESRESPYLEVLERAAARGEIPAGRDLGVLAGIVPALALQRLVFSGEVPDADFARTVIDEVLVPLATAPLPEHA